jgi:4-aminobutyrate aminotransferase
MMGDALYRRDGQALSRLQNLRFFPLAITSGSGSRVTDADGRQLLDLSASWGAASLGYGHPALQDAVARAMATQAGASILSSSNAPAVELAEKLLAIMPGPRGRRVWLGHSGSDANETAARAVISATGRPRIVAFSGAYHGGTAGSMAISGHTAQAGVDKASGLTLIPYPNAYRPYRDDPGGDAVIQHLEELFDTSCPADEVAAVFFEPTQADGGLIPPPPGFLAKLAALCARHGILTVCDEVKVGLARPGVLHCFQLDGIVPDLLVLGKGLGGGLPISAVIGPEEIMNHQSAFSFQTLHGNPVCASAALAVLETIEAEDLAAHAAKLGARFMDKLRGLADRHEAIGDVRGRGLAIGVELVEDRATKAPAKRLTAQTAYRAYELGAVLYYVGMESNVLELTPPLVLTETEVDEAVDKISQALDGAARGLVPDERLHPFEGW